MSTINFYSFWRQAPAVLEQFLSFVVLFYLVNGQKMLSWANVTRLGFFLKDLVDTFCFKVAQIFGNFECFLENIISLV